MTDTDGRPVFIWARVSTTDQRADNQLPEQRAWAARLGCDDPVEYVTEDSAWQRGTGHGKGALFDRKRAEMLAAVRKAGNPVVLVRAIDRLSRLGSEDMLRYLRMLAEAGADVRSEQEPWLNTADPFAREILIGLFATLARYQSDQRSKNIKDGLRRRAAEGGHTGRKQGAKDKARRRKGGYEDAWAPGGARRLAHEAGRAAREDAPC